MKLALKELDLSMENEYIKYHASWQNEEFIPMSANMQSRDFKDYVVHLKSMQTDPPRLLVPSTTLFLINEEDKEILGAIDIRHFLNDGLLKNGGHIGYGIKKEHRGKKLAEKMVKLSKPILEELKLEEVLICCDKENKASDKTLINLNAELENEVLDTKNSKQRIVKRYWLRVSTL